MSEHYQPVGTLDELRKVAGAEDELISSAQAGREVRLQQLEAAANRAARFGPLPQMSKATEPEEQTPGSSLCSS